MQEPVITVTAVKSLKPTTSSLTKEEFLASAYNKLIWINSFGAAAMSENKSGILMQFKYVIPGLVYTHFVSDLMELAIFDLAKIDDNYLKKLNQNLNAIFKFCYLSPGRRKDTKNFF